MKKVLILLTIIIVAHCSSVPLTMLDLNDHPHAKCLDGSAAGYYMQQAKDPDDSTKWVIQLNGGGECDSESACKDQLTSALGSSNYFNGESDASSWYFGSDYCPYNPTFCGWNHVMDPYCTQDLHSGQVMEATEDTWGLYFSGHLVMEAMLDEMDKKYNLGEATEIILSGISAGGIGVWMNLDYIANRYPKAKVTGATVAGYYFYATYYDGTNHTDPGGMADFRESAWSTTYDLYQAYVDEDCKEYYENEGLSPGACMISNQSMPFIQSDAFAIQSQTDQVVLTGHDCWPGDYMYETEEQEYMHMWHQNMTNAVMGLTKKAITTSSKAGYFTAACYTHGDFTHSYPLIDGLSYNAAFSKFYMDEKAADQRDVQWADECGEMCNPTCP